mgnify:CR=1 FL=1
MVEENQCQATLQHYQRCGKAAHQLYPKPWDPVLFHKTKKMVCAARLRVRWGPAGTHPSGPASIVLVKKRVRHQQERNKVPQKGRQEGAPRRRNTGNHGQYPAENCGKNRKNETRDQILQIPFSICCIAPLSYDRIARRL